VPPTRLRADPDFGKVELTWRSTGSRWYWVFRRDLTAGEKEFVREEIAVEGTKADVHNLVDGHRYEFTVAAFSDGGIGPQAEPVRATMPSPLPTGLAARSDSPGVATVTWKETRPGTLYRMQLRDATAAEQWRTDPFPANGSRYETTMLPSGSRYEFRLQLADGTATDPVAVVVK
jgi:hypothetical protein